MPWWFVKPTRFFFFSVCRGSTSRKRVCCCKRSGGGGPHPGRVLKFAASFLSPPPPPAYLHNHKLYTAKAGTSISRVASIPYKRSEAFCLISVAGGLLSQVAVIREHRVDDAYLGCSDIKDTLRLGLVNTPLPSIPWATNTRCTKTTTTTTSQCDYARRTGRLKMDLKVTPRLLIYPYLEERSVKLVTRDSKVFN